MTFKPIILNQTYDDAVVTFLNRLAQTNESVLGYHYPFYRNMLENIGIGEAFNIGLLDKEDNLTAFLPGFIKTSKAGTVYSSLPFFGPNAGVLCNYEIPDVEEIHAQLLDFLFIRLENYDMISVSIYTPFNADRIISVYDKLLVDSFVIEKFTNYISLDEFNLGSSLAYDIRKAKKSGVVVKSEIEPGEIDEVFDIYNKNCEDYGIPAKPRKCIENLVKEGMHNSNTKTYLAKIDEKIIGALIMIYSPITASYYLPCSLHEYRSYQPTTFLINHALNEAIMRGIKFWNWESSPSQESGVFKFKKKWGSSNGEYRIYIKPYKEPEFYQAMGKLGISELFPYFFVYPFNQLN